MGAKLRKCRNFDGPDGLPADRGRDAMKTTFLITSETPDGWTLEDLLIEVQNDILRRSQKITEDPRAEARRVVDNNIEILGLLTRCIAKAQDSTSVLNSLGPHVDGQPRIGAL